ncbi:hypothetical protein [Hoeflea sp. TYP-13]|uniref:phage tail tube protein n=1 Tax=Hoeflea sp. TYP-13 TaxID=3230023 RepID=UPI0034C5E7D4
MGVSHGKNGKVKLGANTVAETTKWTLSESAAAADTTSQGDTAQTHLTGIPGWSAQVEGWYDPADTNGQSALAIGASVSIEFYTDTDGSGKTYKSGTASVTDIQWESAMDGTNSFSISLQGNGALATATVA